MPFPSIVVKGEVVTLMAGHAPWVAVGFRIIPFNSLPSPPWGPLGAVDTLMAGHTPWAAKGHAFSFRCGQGP